MSWGGTIVELSFVSYVPNSSDLTTEDRQSY